MDIKDFIHFLVYVVPGFIAIEMYRGYHPAKKTSVFSQITWSIIYGLSIYIIIIYIDEHYLGHKLQTNYNPESFPPKRFLISLIFAGFLCGYVRHCWHKIKLLLSSKYDSLSFLYPDPQSSWAEVNKPENKDWAVVFLKNGCVYLGWIGRYDYDPNEKDHAFLLTKAERVDEQLNSTYKVTGDCVYISTENVSHIEFVKPPDST